MKTMYDLARALFASVDGMTNYQGEMSVWVDDTGEVQVEFSPRPDDATFRALLARIEPVQYQLKTSVTKVKLDKRPLWSQRLGRWVLPWTQKNPVAINVRAREDVVFQ